MDKHQQHNYKKCIYIINACFQVLDKKKLTYIPEVRQRKHNELSNKMMNVEATMEASIIIILGGRILFFLNIRVYLCGWLYNYKKLCLNCL